MEYVGFFVMLMIKGPRLLHWIPCPKKYLFDYCNPDFKSSRKQDIGKFVLESQTVGLQNGRYAAALSSVNI